MGKLYAIGGIALVIVAIALWGYVMKEQRDVAVAEAATYKVVATTNKIAFEHLTTLSIEQNKKVSELEAAKKSADAARSAAEANAKKMTEANEQVRAWLKNRPKAPVGQECADTQAKILEYRVRKGLH